MLTLYFSGTGNSRYIAEYFSKTLQADCHSIEDEADFAGLITHAGTIAFCYPVYGSCVPYIMREFVIKHRSYLSRKNIIILCTQYMFSGDGARVFSELLVGTNANIIYAEHFNMPNNLCNFFLFPVADKGKTMKKVQKAERKLVKTCENINNGVSKKRGFNVFSKHLGFYSQRSYFSVFEKDARRDVRVSASCIACAKCIRLCPMNNLELIEQRISPKGECTLCYRCVNICPQKAITVFLHSKVKKQYKGLDTIL